MLIVGNTYPVKDQIRALGGRWNAGKKGWDVPDDKAKQAQELVQAAPKKAAKPTHRQPSSYKKGDGGPRGHREGGCYMCGSYYCEGARGGLCDDD